MKLRPKQQGMALIMLVFIVALAATGYLLHALNPVALKIERDKKTVAALAEAKTALIGRAITDSNRPGSLRCPDGGDDGIADWFVGTECPAYIGRFPWKTLGTGMLTDGYGETLWYALSSNYRDNLPVTINGSSDGSLVVDGAGDIVAIIFSAGPVLGAQTNRPSYNVVDYLEGENSNGDKLYSNLGNGSNNDKLLTISRKELIGNVEKRVLGEVVNVLTEYYANPSHPYFPHQLPNMPVWFTANGWESRVNYEVAEACIQATPNCSGSGYITDGIFTDVRVRLTSVGTGQKRIIR